MVVPAAWTIVRYRRIQDPSYYQCRSVANSGRKVGDGIVAGAGSGVGAGSMYRECRHHGAASWHAAQRCAADIPPCCWYPSCCAQMEVTQSTAICTTCVARS